jgi:transposase-like protein
VTLQQIATDFGIHPITLSTWMRQADVEAWVKPGVSSDQLAVLREARGVGLPPRNRSMRPAGAGVVPARRATGSAAVVSRPWTRY